MGLGQFSFYLSITCTELAEKTDLILIKNKNYSNLESKSFPMRQLPGNDLIFLLRGKVSH